MRIIYYLRLPIHMVLVSMAALSILRLIFSYYHWDYFGSLNLLELAKAFAMGIRFDLATVVMALAPFLLILSIPSNYIQTPKILKTITFLCLIPIAGMVLFGFADIEYFGEVQRHVGAEILRLDADWSLIFEIALISRIKTTALAFSIVVLLSLLWWHRLIKPIQFNPISGRIVSKILVFVAVTLSWVVMGRGFVLYSTPIHTLDAFAQGNERVAHLALNGSFVALKTREQASSNNIHFLSPDDYKLIANKYPHGQHPFQAKLYTPQIPDGQRNVVLILLESWGYKYIDGLSGTHYGATPFMDSLVKRSLVYDQFYAAGQRSIVGIQAILTSTPSVSNTRILGGGLELSQMSRFGEIIREKGYQSLMVQTSSRRSYHMDAIAQKLGFDEFYGQEDIPILKKYPSEMPAYGWDYEGLMFFESKINQLHQNSAKPFFSFMFTGTTHEPFMDPGVQFHVRPNDTNTENRFLNTLRYSDWAIEQFMTAASKQPWYKNTTFIFLADHSAKVGSTISLPEQFHIPLVIYSPNGEFPPARNKRIASQYDLLPSLGDLMGIEAPKFTALGHSLFAPLSNLPAHAMVAKGDLTGFIWDKGWVLMTDQGLVVDQNVAEPLQPWPKPLDQLLWRTQTAVCWLNANVWVSGHHKATSGPCAL